ncbi:MAG TPA: tetratricopeptide repeat protein [Pseudolabrys sp.]|nr:tetratricopeptide repeat protein [Pseudolabrys sp.]
MVFRSLGVFAQLSAAVWLALAGGALADPYEDGLLAYNRGDFATALKVFRPLAESGDVRAENALGRMYARGEGVAKDFAEAKLWFGRATEQERALSAYNSGDFAAALRMYRPLADKGQILAEYIVGLIYANGQGVAQDYAEAMKWHRKAAEQGEAKAQFSVGVMYFKGLGVAADRAEAFKWYRRAANQGNATAIYNLAAMYAKGESTPADLVTARMLYSLAADRGIKAAAEAKQQLAASMSREQIAEADKRAAEWRPKPEH